MCHLQANWWGTTRVLSPCPVSLASLGGGRGNCCAYSLDSWPLPLRPWGDKGPTFPLALLVGVSLFKLLWATAKGLLGLLVAVTVVGHHARGRAWAAGLRLELGAEDVERLRGSPFRPFWGVFLAARVQGAEGLIDTSSSCTQAGVGSAVRLSQGRTPGLFLISGTF